MGIKRLRCAAMILWTLGGVAALVVVLWLTQAFVADRQLGESRLVFGWKDPRFNVFHRLFLQIRPGMSRSELEGVIQKLYPPEGKRRPPIFWQDQPTYITLFLDPETEAEPNCEGIFLRVSNGVITAKAYSMD